MARSSARARATALLAACCAAVALHTLGAAAHGGDNTNNAPFATSIGGLGGPPAGFTPVGTPGTSTMVQNSLQNVDPLAVCNDGSPGAYYFAPGSGEQANVWLVYLEVRHCERTGCAAAAR
jgi:hypothetical protein